MININITTSTNNNDDDNYDTFLIIVIIINLLFNILKAPKVLYSGMCSTHLVMHNSHFAVRDVKKSSVKLFLSSNPCCERDQ